MTPKKDGQIRILLKIILEYQFKQCWSSHMKITLMSSYDLFDEQSLVKDTK